LNSEFSELYKNTRCVKLPKIRNYLYIGRRKILKWILKKWDLSVWTGFMKVRVGTSGWLEHNNEFLCSIEGGEFLDFLSDLYLLKNDDASWSFL
jgi:hypothetical protein